MESSILSHSDKEALARPEVIPVIDPSFDDDKLKNIFQYYSLTPAEMDIEIQKYASELLGKGKVNEAWQVLLTTG